MMLTLMKYRYECGLAPAKQKIVSALFVGFKGSEISFLTVHSHRLHNTKLH
jgi:hypothetical protein